MAGPDSNPAAKSFRFDAAFQGHPVLGTVVARHDSVSLHPTPDVCIEIKLDMFIDMYRKAIVAAHTRRPHEQD